MNGRAAVLSLGSINADFQMRVDELPDFGQVGVGERFIRLGGGKAANVAYFASRLATPTYLLGRVGNDDLREQALRSLRTVGINISGVSSSETSGTGIAIVAVAPDGNKSILLAENANVDWTESAVEDVLRTMAGAPKGSVLVVDYEIPALIIQRAIETAKLRQMPVVIDPSPPERVEPEVLSLATFVTPNAFEAKRLTGVAADTVDQAISACRSLAELGVDVPCVKLPDGGCVSLERGRVLHVPSIPVEVVDSTGAGDAFAGGLAVAFLEKKTIVETVCFAEAAAHLAVTAYGAQPSYATRGEVEAFASQLKDRAHFIEA